jgi:hypothetical protein
MNERIRELAEQAFGSTLDTDPILVFEAEKFVELIVRKCLELAHDEHKMALEYEWDNDDTATSIRESISKHFGVEE